MALNYVGGSNSNAAAMTRSQLVSFKARRSVNIPFKENRDFPGSDYVKRVERVVQVAFPDSLRIQYLGDGVWRSRLKPVTFFSVSATPICELRVFYDAPTRALRLQSDKLVLEFLGLPAEMNRDVDFRFSLSGDLRVSSGRASSTFYGSVSLGLASDLPLPLSLIPEPIVLPVGDGILDRILAAMEGALASGLSSDYKQWCGREMEARVRLF